MPPMEMPKGFNSLEELQQSNEEMYRDFQNLIWHHVRRFQKALSLPESALEDIVSALWVKLLRTSKSYRNPAGMNLVIINRLMRTLQEQRKWNHEIALGLGSEYSDLTLSAHESYREQIRAEMVNLSSREIAVIELLLMTENPITVSQILEREPWWVERRIEGAKAKLPALSILTSL